MGLISRVSSRTYRSTKRSKKPPKMAEVEQNEVIEQEVQEENNWDAVDDDEEVGEEVVMAEVKVFNKWSVDDVVCADLALKNYINFSGASAKYLPHSSQRYNKIRFRKAQCPIIERLINSLMMHGRNNGKKMLTMRIVKHAFEIIYLLTGENPVQVLVSAIRNAAFRNTKTMAECLADELMNASKGSSNSYAIKKKDELERVAKSNR